eukprot:gnl/Chilomastix_caulleri/2359.p1 GENE.gnl/Chilomastix_caulleri/2359~~gnl/Chilomastix_caulleri/2359.p1  ORF type:complete len:266 (-),score=74.49 gnl/Chilomastix_caulleri/2359:18-719(-)
MPSLSPQNFNLGMTKILLGQLGELSKTIGSFVSESIRLFSPNVEQLTQKEIGRCFIDGINPTTIDTHQFNHLDTMAVTGKLNGLIWSHNRINKIIADLGQLKSIQQQQQVNNGGDVINTNVYPPSSVNCNGTITPPPDLGYANPIPPIYPTTISTKHIQMLMPIHSHNRCHNIKLWLTQCRNISTNRNNKMSSKQANHWVETQQVVVAAGTGSSRRRANRGKKIGSIIGLVLS